MRKRFLLTFLIFLFFAFTTKVSAVTLDPNNPGGRPNPQTLVDAGITQVRVVLKNDETTISYVQELKDAGINVIGIINWEYSPQAWTNSNQLSDNYINNFSTQIINDAHFNFGDLFAYQVWNEPDGTQGGSIAIDPVSYAKLLASVNSALNNINSGQTVLSAGFVSGNLDYLRQVIAAAGGVFPADGVALHAYNNPEDPASINAIISMIQAMSSMTGTKVWITEFGWQTGDLAKQAAWLAQVYALRDNPATASLLQTVMWYAFSDVQNPGFGLFNVDGTPKPAFFVLLAMLQGNPLSADVLANLLAGILVACKNSSGTLIGYGISQSYCDSLVECKDNSGKLIGYAPAGLCKIQEDIKNTCGGPIDLDNVGFPAEMALWRFDGKFNAKDMDDLGSATNWLQTNFVLQTVGSYPHFDLEPFSNQLVGSKTQGYYNVATRVTDFRPPTQLSSRIPGKVEPSGFSIGPQEYQKQGENEEDYTKRVFTTSTSSLGNKEKYGERAEMKATNFNACLQRLTCNPAVERCIRESDAFNSPCNDPNNPNCHDCLPTDDPRFCVSYGKLFNLTGKLSFEEPADLLAISKSLDNFGKKYSDIQDPSGSLAQIKSNSNTYLSNAKSSLYTANPIQAKVNTANAAEPTGALNTSLTLGASGSGTNYNVTYRYCIWHESPCGMGDIRSTINGTQVNLWKSTTNEDPNNACLEPGWGGAPSFNGVSLPFTVEISSGGNRTGPQGICPDSVTTSCTISIDPADQTGKTLKSTCGGTLPPPPPVDCRNCPSWAPKAACEQIQAQTLPTINECSDGKCESTQKVEENVPFSDDINFTFNFDDPNNNVFFQILGQVLRAIGLNKISCQRPSTKDECWCAGQNYDRQCTAYDLGAGCTNHPGSPGKWQCAFNAAEYILYAYPSSNLIGDYGNKSSYTRALEAMYKIPGQTTKYFKKEPAMGTVSLQLTPSNITAQSSGTLEDYYFRVKEGDTKKINVKYFDFYQPLYSSLCLADQFGSLPGKPSDSYQQSCKTFDFYSGDRTGVPLDLLDPEAPIITSGDVNSAVSAASSANNIPIPVLMAIFEAEYGTGPFDQATYICKRNSDFATGPMQITDGTVIGYVSPAEMTAWGISSDWAPGADFSTDGRCKIGIAMEIAARILNGKANDAKNAGYISEVNFDNLATAAYASGGYYGTRNCAPDALTQHAWGKNISYCDYFVYRVSKYNGYPGQACTILSPTCDGVGPFDNGTSISGPTQGTNVDAPINQVPSTPVTNPKGDTLTQKEFLIDVENLMNKYKDQIKPDKTELKDLPPEMIAEIKALAEKYKN